ncbi:MAG: GtrA family protein [Ruminococcaceae bacterium]|nr:GtrA family protein [Oscillospiraceae bacterium]
MKELFKKYREIIMYLIFGVLTTAVGLGTYSLCFWIAEHALNIPMDAPESTAYIVTYFVIQILQWVAAVLTAFYTNRRWVFTDAERGEGTLVRQLTLFAGSRVLTLILDIVSTYAFIYLLKLWINDSAPPTLLGISFTAEFIAKIITSVLVVVANYVLSKLFVFKNKK